MVSNAARQHLLLRLAQLHAPVARDVPVGKQLQLAPQQRLVIGRQGAGAGGQLPLQQHVHGLQVPGVGGLRVVLAQVLDHGLAAHVGQQHEALRLVPGQDAGHGQARALQQRLHVHEGAAVLLLRRRVHDDEGGAALRVHAQVAAEAGVAGGGAHAGRQQAVAGRQRRQPLAEGVRARRVVPGDGRKGRSRGCGAGGGSRAGRSWIIGF